VLLADATSFPRIQKHAKSRKDRETEGLGGSNPPLSSSDTPTVRGYAGDTVPLVHSEDEGLQSSLRPKIPRVRSSKGFRTAGFGDARPDTITSPTAALR
jgi:hypothetical protein